MNLRYKRCALCKRQFTGHFNAKLCGDECRLQWLRNYSKGYQPAYRERHRKPQPEREPIPPFPNDIDRDSFGHWLSGFADGEATFGLRTQVHNAHVHQFVSFRITLRDDDTELLKLIRSYWGCGMIYFSDNSRSKIPNAKPIAAYGIQAVSDMTSIIIPHFDRFPLRSKKRNDFLVWKQGVELMAEVQSRPIIGRLGLSGIMPRWTNEEREKFDSLCELLKHQRIYTSLRSS